MILTTIAFFVKKFLENTFHTSYNVTSTLFLLGAYINLYGLDDNLQLSVLTDRSQGATSLENNKVEIMVHRKTLKDDHKGVGEAINEKAFGYGLVARGKHQITVLNPTIEGTYFSLH